MNILEIRNMINDTISSNGEGHITGQALNLALHAIVDAIESGAGSNENNGSLGGALTILIPNDGTWDADNSNTELRENNTKCYFALKNQTEPLLVFLKYFGAKAPMSQTALRLRHLYTDGEGSDYFAFGYPSVHTDEEKYGLLAYAEEMYRLNVDGSINKINLMGKNFWTGADIPLIKDWTDAPYLDGIYTKSSLNPEITIGMNDVEISEYDGNTLTIKGLFGNNTEYTNVPVVNGKIILNEEYVGGKELMTDTMGPVQIPIELVVETSEFLGNTYVSKIYSENPIGVYGGVMEEDGSLSYNSFIQGLNLTRKS